MTNIHIADDLVIQILSRLPIKSLFRFKCVSKAWCSLISDYSTQARVLSTLSGLFYEIRSLQRVEYNFACLSNENSGTTSNIDTISISLSFLPFYPDFEIVDCCNGLLLCAAEGPVYYVCNPLLKSWIALPNPQTKCRYLEATLVRHPEDSAHFRVFFLTGCSYRFRGPNQITFYVFDSAAGKGEIRDAFFDKYHLMFEQSPVLINEALHYACSPLHILRVNVNGWTCDAIDLPNTSRESKGTILEFEGHLCYVCWHLDIHAGEDKLQIWMLKDWDTEDWVKMHEICNKVLVAKILEAGGSPIGKGRMLSEYTRPLAFGPGLGFALFTDQRNVFSCDLQSMKVEKIFSLGEDDFDGTYRRLRIHPALSSPSSNTLEEARQQLQSTK